MYKFIFFEGCEVDVSKTFQQLKTQNIVMWYPWITIKRKGKIEGGLYIRNYLLQYFNNIKKYSKITQLLCNVNQ